MSSNAAPEAGGDSKLPFVVTGAVADSEGTQATNATVVAQPFVADARPVVPHQAPVVAQPFVAGGPVAPMQAAAVPCAGAGQASEIAKPPAAPADGRIHEEIQANQAVAAPQGALVAGGAVAPPPEHRAPLPQLGVNNQGQPPKAVPFRFTLKGALRITEAEEAARKQKALLRIAVTGGDIAYVTQYLDGGGDVNVAVPQEPGSYTWSEAPLLHLAVRQNQKAIADLLLDRGANVRATDKWGKTALHRGCAVACDLEIIQCLMDAGADVDAADGDGLRPVHHACRLRGDQVERGKAILRFLKARGANVEALTKSGAPLLFFAKELEMVRFLLDEFGTNLRATDKDDCTILFYVRKAEVVPFCVARGVDINARDKQLNTALHCMDGRTSSEMPEMVDFMRALLKHGADVDAANSDRERPIHCFLGDYVPCEIPAEPAIALLEGNASFEGPKPEGITWRTVKRLIAKALVHHIAMLYAEGKPLDPSTAWLKWLMTRPDSVLESVIDDPDDMDDYDWKNDSDDDVEKAPEEDSRQAQGQVAGGVDDSDDDEDEDDSDDDEDGRDDFASPAHVRTVASRIQCLIQDLAEQYEPDQSTPPMTRDRALESLREHGWDKRKHLVCWYFGERRRRWGWKGGAPGVTGKEGGDSGGAGGVGADTSE